MTQQQQQQMVVEQALAVAVQHHQAGMLPQAEAIYRQVLAQQPNHPDALHLLGVIAGQVGRHDVGLHLIRRAIAIKPNVPDYYNNLGRVLVGLEALDEAIQCFRHAVELRPAYPEALKGLGNALRKREKIDEAIIAYRQALAHKPDMAEAWYDLGNALADRDQPAEAIECYRKAVALDPGFAQGWNNLGNALKDSGQVTEAIEVYRKALALRPDFLPTHFNLGFALLLKGDFTPGLEELEARRKLIVPGSPFAEFRQPAWDGEPLQGRSILLFAEQGLGDTIQMIRYLPMVASRGPGTIVVQCQSELARLFRSQPAKGVQIVARGEAVPKCDLQCPLMSLPAVLKTTLETIPSPVPYLKADPELSAKWRQRMVEAKGLKVGLNWSGSSAFSKNRTRSLSLEALAPLAEVANVQFVSLRKDKDEGGRMKDEIKDSGVPDSSFILHPSSFPLTDWTNELGDFADTAALMDNLDLVITTDTAVAHLAGAMGKPTWVLLQCVPDWRWMLDRPDCPWYPTMKLFRQPSLGDWESPIRQVVQDLQAQVSSMQ